MLSSSLLEMANSNLGKEDVISLVESMCSQNGLQEQSSFNFDDFCQILSPQMDKIWNAGLDWQGMSHQHVSYSNYLTSKVNLRHLRLAFAIMTRITAVTRMVSFKWWHKRVHYIRSKCASLFLRVRRIQSSVYQVIYCSLEVKIHF